jgi:hypothetical protein
MVIPFIALIAIIILVVFFLSKAGKRKTEGKEPVKTERGTMR